MYKSLQKDIKELKEKNRAREEEHKELVEELEKLKTQNTSELEGISNKLSNYAQHAIQSSKGPFKTNELLKIFTNDIFDKRNKEALAFIRKYTNNIDGVKKQLSQVSETLQVHMAYRKKQKVMDDKFIKNLKKLEKTIEKEEEKELKSGTKLKVQSTLDQCFGWESGRSKLENNFDKNHSSPTKVVVQTKASEEGMPAKNVGNRNGKRMAEDDSSSSQENGEKNIASKSSKHLKLNSSRSTTESSNSTEYMSVDESDDHPEPMSVASSESSQSSTQPMSISESSQSDAMSVDDSRESMKTAKKSTEKFSKQSEEKAAEYNGEVETVPERRFYLRGKPL